MKYKTIDFKISCKEELFQIARDLIATIAGSAGCESFEDSDDGLIGYAPAENYNGECFSETKLAEEIANFPMEDVEVTYEVSDAEDKDWNEEWESKGFDPIIVDRLCCVHDLKHVPVKRYIYDITIDARQAFGTGTHETTRMILYHMMELYMTDMTVLDCGTGTGILAIASLKMGAQKAVAFDIDDWSVENAKHNAELNKVSDKMEVLLGSSDELLTGNVQEVEKFAPYSVVFANINKNILLRDMDSFAKMVDDDGELVVSGFYKKDVPDITAKAKSLGLKLGKKYGDGEWRCLVFKK